MPTHVRYSRVTRLRLKVSVIVLSFRAFRQHCRFEHIVEFMMFSEHDGPKTRLGAQADGRQYLVCGLGGMRASKGECELVNRVNYERLASCIMKRSIRHHQPESLK